MSDEESTGDRQGRSLDRRAFLAVLGGATAGCLGSLGIDRNSTPDSEGSNGTDSAGEPTTRAPDDWVGTAPVVFDADEVIDLNGRRTLRPFTETIYGDRASFVASPHASGRRALRVSIPEGDHYGTSLRYRFDEQGVPDPTALYVQYHVYFPPEFVVASPGGKLPGPAGTYGRGGWGGRPANGRNGWSARGLFKPSGDPSRPVQLGYYAYHADMESRFGETLEWDIADRGALELGEWHRVEQWIDLNTPGKHDGVLRGWVDGRLAFERTDLRFRDVRRLKIQELWFNVYYGGTDPSPADNAVEFDVLSMAWGDTV